MNYGWMRLKECHQCGVPVSTNNITFIGVGPIRDALEAIFGVDPELLVGASSNVLEFINGENLCLQLCDNCHGKKFKEILEAFHKQREEALNYKIGDNYRAAALLCFMEGTGIYSPALHDHVRKLLTSVPDESFALAKQLEDLRLKAFHKQPEVALNFEMSNYDKAAALLCCMKDTGYLPVLATRVRKLLESAPEKTIALAEQQLESLRLDSLQPAAAVSAALSAADNATAV